MFQPRAVGAFGIGSITSSSVCECLTGLNNWTDADEPLLSLRIGEQQTETGFLQRYHTVTASAHYLLRRHVRVLGEAGWDFEREAPRVAIGTTLAW